MRPSVRDIAWVLWAVGVMPLHLCAAELTPEMTTTEPIIAATTSQHSILIAAQRVRYTASFAETVLNDAKGEPQASISSTSYIRDGIRNISDRPVLFAFNGGPGASSSPLHFGALGPRAWAEKRGPGGARQLADNDDSLIDVADLVFIDPVGTGLSRVREGGDPGIYWSIEGDAGAALTLIRNWLRDHGRTESPVFIAGESYGGFRLATLAKDLKDIKVAGLILISPLLDASASAGAPGNDLPYVFELPTLAAAAWYHEKIHRDGRTVQQFYEEAARFAQTEYVVALQQGAALPAATRTRLARKMAALTGLPAAQIEAANLRLDSEQFLKTLLADRNLIVGRLDVRVTGPRPSAPPKDLSRPAAADDPALGLKGSNVIKSEPIKKYLQEELGVTTSRDYVSLTLDVNFRWNWRASDRRPSFYVNPTPNIATLMQQQPQARVLLLGGYYDLATPLLAPRYALNHTALPLERLTMVAFDAGHSPFEGADNRARVSSVIRTFLNDSRKR